MHPLIAFPQRDADRNQGTVWREIDSVAGDERIPLRPTTPHEFACFDIGDTNNRARIHLVALALWKFETHDAILRRETVGEPFPVGFVNHFVMTIPDTQLSV